MGQRPSFCFVLFCFVLFCARNLYKVTREATPQVSECRVSGVPLQRLSLNLLRIYMYGNEEAHACMHDADEGGVYTSAHVRYLPCHSRDEMTRSCLKMSNAIRCGGLGHLALYT